MFIRMLLFIILTNPIGVTEAASAYPVGPYVDETGFHMIWMWRDTKYANTTYNLSYATSVDLKTWRTCDSEAIVPLDNNKLFTVVYGKTTKRWRSIYSGLLNSRQELSFVNGKIVITYIINNNNGTQIANSILENCEWKRQIITNNCEHIDTEKLGTIKDVGRIKFSQIFKNKGEIFQYVSNKLKQCSEEMNSDGKFTYDDDLNILKVERRSDLLKSNTESELLTRYLDVYKMIDLDEVYLSWAAKANNGDRKPQCIIDESCNESNYLSKVIFSNSTTSEFLKDQDNDYLKVWAGSQASFAAYVKNDVLYFTHYNKNKELTLSIVKDNKVEKMIVLDPANNEWDSHNNIEMVYHQDLLWITGNLHNDQLKIYVIDGRNLVNTLVEPPDSRYTYPKFIRYKNKLLMMAREGESGDGEYWIFELSERKIISRWKLFGAE